MIRARVGSAPLQSAACIVLALLAIRCEADQPASRSSVGPSADETWWTGPLLASAAAALPAHGVVIESYAFNSVIRSRFAESGRSRPVGRSESSGSLTELFYGATNALTVGLVGRFGRVRMSEDTGPAHVHLGDFTVQAQYQLAEQSRDSPATISLVLGETLPTARFDRLTRSDDGLGAGAYTTTLAVYSQRLLVMPSGRPLRSRLNFSYSLSNQVNMQDVSIYGTANGFRGRARPGSVTEVDWAAEYSITRHWVGAVDIDYLHGASTAIAGVYMPAPITGIGSASVDERLGSTTTISFAPAIEYNLSADLGVIAGVIIPVAGRNASSAPTATLAVNISLN
jgi:hypothetical protein